MTAAASLHPIAGLEPCVFSGLRSWGQPIVDHLPKRIPLSGAVLLAATVALSACVEPLVDGPQQAPDAQEEVSDVGPTADCTGGLSCDSGLVCDKTSGLCVPCTVAADCADSTATCVNNQCVVPTPCTTDKKCGPLDRVCDKAAGVCVQCLADADCDPGLACVQRHCTAPPPKCGSDAECAAVGWVCSAAGNCVACTDDAHCPLTAWCNQGQCTADVCTAGQGKCADTAHRAICQPNGGGWTPVACPDDKVCQPSAGGASCEAMVCNAGKVGCVGQVVMRCSDNGATRHVVADCGEPAADGGARMCLHGKCVPAACSPGVTACADDKTVAACDADGKTVATSKCADPTPVCAAGKCVVCLPGAMYCAKAPDGVAATVAMKCHDSGADGDIALVCTGKKYCVNGACTTTTLCAPGTLFCGPAGADGTSTLVLMCNNLGSDGDIHQVCPDQKVCVAGLCQDK